MVSLAVALTQHRPASAVALVVFILTALGVASYVALRRESGIMRQLDKKRLTAGWILLFTTLAVTFAIPASRRVAIDDILGFPIRDPVRIVAIRVLEGARTYRLIVSVVNPSSGEQLVTSVGLVVATGPGVDTCAGASPFVFQVAGTVHLARSGLATTNVTEALEPGFHEFATGSTSGLCLTSKLSLAFPASVPLPPRELSQLVIDLPKEFRLIRDDSPPEAPRERQQTVPVTLPVDAGASEADEQEPGYVGAQLGIAGNGRTAWLCHAANAAQVPALANPCSGEKRPL